jgi:hypothetical protein
MVSVLAAPQATPTPSLIQFSQATYQVAEGTVQTNITLTRTGPNTVPATVDYVVNDVTATQKGDFTFASGFVLFLAGETSKTFPVLISDDGYEEGIETAQLQLTGASGATVGTPSTATLEILDDRIEGINNPIDDPRNFAAQHYHDFLNRDAIASNDQAGLDFWTKLRVVSPSPSASLRNERTFPPLSSCQWNFKTRGTSRFASTAHLFLTASQGLEAYRVTPSFCAMPSNWGGT